jgi:hypothetical protein
VGELQTRNSLTTKLFRETMPASHAKVVRLPDFYQVQGRVCHPPAGPQTGARDGLAPSWILTVIDLDDAATP